jgi:hypothetical protein
VVGVGGCLDSWRLREAAPGLVVGPALEHPRQHGVRVSFQRLAEPLVLALLGELHVERDDAQACPQGGVDAFATYVMAENPTAAAVDVASLNLGLAGDVQGMVKKILRGDPAATRPEYTEKVTARLADVLAAVAVLARATGVSPASIAQGNLTKLADRASRGVLKGAGDHR